jgi:hypothetical protein
MKIIDLQINDVVQVERNGKTFISWVTDETSCGVNDAWTYALLAHSVQGDRATKKNHSGFYHDVKQSKITLLHRPANVQERDLFIALNPLS